MDSFDWQADRHIFGSPVRPIMAQGCSLYSGSCHSSTAQMKSHSSRGRAATGWESMSSFSFFSFFSSPLGDVSLDKGAATRTMGTTDEKRTEKDREMGEEGESKMGRFDIWITFLSPQTWEKNGGEKKDGRRHGGGDAKPSLRCLF